MSGLIKAVKKVFKKVVKSPIFKAIATAAIIYFTVGTATAYFAAPQLGLGAAASSTASSMWTATTSFFGAEAAATSQAALAAGTDLAGTAAVNASQAATAAEGLVSGGAVEPFVGTATMSGGGSISASTAQVAAGQSSFAGAGGIADVAGADALSLASGTQAAGGFAPTINGAMGGALDTAMTTGASLSSAASAPTGMMAWLENNPMATMMLGQGVSGMAQGYMAEKASAEAQKAEDERLAKRGLMGYDNTGRYAGVVSSQRKPTVEETVATPASAAPAVQSQQTGAPPTPATPAPTAPGQNSVPVAREQLPQMNKDGLIARG